MTQSALNRTSDKPLIAGEMPLEVVETDQSHPIDFHPQLTYSCMIIPAAVISRNLVQRGGPAHSGMGGTIKWPIMLSFFKSLISSSSLYLDRGYGMYSRRRLKAK